MCLLNKQMEEKGIPTTLQRSRATPKDSKRQTQASPPELATVGKTLLANGVQPTFLSSHILGAPDLMPELSAYARTQQPVCPRQGENQAKLSEYRDETNTKETAVPGRERTNKWASQNRIHEYEFRKEETVWKVTFSRFSRGLEELTLVRTLTLHRLLPSFPGCHR